jgi:hypothetical protein
MANRNSRTPTSRTTSADIPADVGDALTRGQLATFEGASRFVRTRMTPAQQQQRVAELEVTVRRGGLSPEDLYIASGSLQLLQAAARP